MVLSSLLDFQNSLKNHALSDTTTPFLIVSKDSYDRREALEVLIESLPKKGITTTTLSGEELSLQQLLQELDTLPFFEERKIVIVHNIEKLANPIITAIKNYLLSPQPTIFLILTASSLPPTKPIYKLLAKQGIILNIPELKAWEKKGYLINWVQNKLAKAKKNVNNNACQYLVQRIGLDKQSLHHEIEKLICYAGDDKTITTEDISAISSIVSNETAWNLRDAIFDGNIKNAINIGKSLLLEGNAIQALLAQLRSQFQTGYHIASTLDNGGMAADITKAFPYMRGKILERNIKLTQKYGCPRFKNAIIEINDADVQSRNKAINPELLLETLITKITI